MALPKLLLLPALLFSLLLLMVPSHCKEDPTPTRPAISEATITICGITAGLLQYRRIQCPKFPKSADSTATFPSLLNILPGVCVPDETSCSSGVDPNSGYVCAGSGVICKKSDAGSTESCQFCRAIVEWLQDLSQTIWETLRKLWSAYATRGAVICVIIVICSFCFWLCYRCYRTMKDGVRPFRFSEIKTMTDHFRTKLSEDTFTKVYKGLWLSDEIPVAVKRFKHFQILESERAFNAELKTLSKIRHQYVVRLFGYCIKNNEHILVFELMERGDLNSHLHPRSRKTRSELFSSWRMRVTVLFQAAQGIDYLHRYAKPRIIHRDIKAANILIFENWVARISNFGMALIGPKPGSDYVKVEEVVGTAGYVDPDWDANDLRATPRNDVYSFGVVMLEVVTGRRPIDHTGIKWPDFAVEQILSGKLMAVLDRRLAVPAGHELEAITRVAQLATQCVRVPGLERPDMSTVVTELESVLALFDPSEASTS